MVVFNITDMPEVFGQLLGLDLEPTGVLIALVGLAVFTLCLAVLDSPMIGIAGIDICWLTFSTYMGWFPVWIMILIGLLVAVLFGRKVTNVITGGQ